MSSSQKYSLKNLSKAHFFNVLLITFLSILYLRDLIFSRSNYMPGYPQTDFYINIYLPEIFDTAVKSGVFPMASFWSSYLNVGYPVGPYFGGFDNSNLFLYLLNIITNKDYIFSIKLLILVSYIITGILMYYYLYYLTKSHSSGLLGSIIFNFAFYRLGEIQYGHIALVIGFFWLPLIFLLTEYTLRKQSYIPPILLGFSMTLVLFTDVIYYISSTLFILIRLLFYVLQKRSKSCIKYLIEKFSVVTIVFVLTMYPFYSQLSSVVQSQVRNISEVAGYSAPLSSLFTRSWAFIDIFPGYHLHAYIGIPALFLSIVGISYLFSKHEGKNDTPKEKCYGFDTDMQIFFFYLLFIFSTLIILGRNTHFWEIYAYLYNNLEFLSKIRVIHRLQVLQIFSIAILSGYGLILLAQKLKNLKMIKNFLILIKIAIILIVVIDLFTLGRIELNPLPNNSPYEPILKDKLTDSNFRMLEVPLIWTISDYRAVAVKEGVFNHLAFTPPYTALKFQLFYTLLNDRDPNKYILSNHTNLNLDHFDIATQASLFGAKYLVIHTEDLSKYYIRYDWNSLVGLLNKPESGFKLISQIDGVYIYKNNKFNGFAFPLDALLNNTVQNYSTTFKQASPNDILITANISRPGLLIISTTYDPFWTAVDSSNNNLKILNFNDVMAIQYDNPGNYTIKLHYSKYDKSLLELLKYYGIALIFCALIIFSTNRRKDD